MIRTKPAAASTIALIFVAMAVLSGTTPASAEPEATVSKTEVEDSFFNQCTGETVDRTYTQHITRRKVGDDYVLAVNWSNGKGVGQRTGDRYTMQWKYQQVSQSNGADGQQQAFTYRVQTKVQAQGSASDYSSDIVVRLRMNADGTVAVDTSDATGIECS